MSVRSRFVAVLASLVLLTLLSWSPLARAERELIVPFHEAGHLVLDQLSGLRINPVSGLGYAGPMGVTFRSAKSDAVMPGGPSSETSTTSIWFSPSADVFVTEHLSVGGLVEIGHTWGAVETAGRRVEIPGATSLTFLPRVGFFVPIGDRIGVWPRAGVGYSSVGSVSFASSGAMPTRETFRSMLLDVDLSVVYRFGETFFMRAGPELGVTLGGRQTSETAGTNTGAGASVLRVSGVVGFGMNLEL